METQVRQIITLPLLLDLFKDRPKIIQREIVNIYAKEYHDAVLYLNFRIKEIGASTEVRVEVASIWQDLLNALNKMGTIERNNLRQQCRHWLINNK